MKEDEELFRELRRVVRDQVAPSTRDEDPPDATPTIPGYRLEEEIHRGGQGVVFRATQEATHRPVALKVLLRGRHASARDRMRFEREIDLASRLRHPDIVTIYDSGLAGDLPWFAMELVQGDRLDVYLARNRPSLTERLALFRRMAEAVAVAHRRGVIHRDLKPGNILVDADGAPRILDFGVAKAWGEAVPTRVTVTGEFMGTLAYASPEQVLGDPSEVDTRADVYSLGVLLYELVTGRLPYEVTGTVAQAIENITRREPEDPRSVSADVDQDLYTILRAALAKDPAERYASADALARDVGHYLAQEPVEARGRSTWYVLRKSLRRHRLPVAAATAVLVLGTFGAALFVREHLRAERQADHARLVREILLEDVLSAAAPERMGSDVTLLEILGVASERIASTLEEAPDAQAAFHLTIGDTYRSLLMWPEAREHLQKAVARYRGVDGGELELARGLDLLGRVLSEIHPPDSLAPLNEALELRRARLPAGHVDVAETERSLARALLSQYADNDLERAGRLLASAEQTFSDALGPRHAEVAATRLLQAQIAGWRGGAERALPVYEEALELFEAQPEVDPRMVDALASLANVSRRLGRYDEARSYLDRAVALTTELYGHERDVEMLRAYANIHFDQGEYDTSERLCRQAVVRELERWARKRPGDAQRIGEVQRRLESAGGDGLDAPYAEAFAILREYRGNGAFELASWANGICQVLQRQGRGAATVPLLQEVSTIGCRAFGADCPIRAETLLHLAREYVEQERPDDARPLLEEILAIDERSDRIAPSVAAEARSLLKRCRGVAWTRTG